MNQILSNLDIPYFIHLTILICIPIRLMMEIISNKFWLNQVLIVMNYLRKHRLLLRDINIVLF